MFVYILGYPMKPAFRCGPITCHPDLMTDRPTLIAAIVAHATTQPDYDGQPIRTVFGRILLETPNSRDKTVIRPV